MDELEEILKRELTGKPLTGKRNEGYVCHESMARDNCFYCGQPANGGIDHVPPVAYRIAYKKPWLLVRSCKRDNVKLRDCNTVELKARKTYARFLRETDAGGTSWGSSGRTNTPNEKKAKNWLLRELGYINGETELPASPLWDSTDKGKGL